MASQAVGLRAAMRQYARQCPSGGTETCDPTGKTAFPTEASQESGKQKSGKATAAATSLSTGSSTGSPCGSSAEAAGGSVTVGVTSSERTSRSNPAAAPLNCRNLFRGTAGAGSTGLVARSGSITGLATSASLGSGWARIVDSSWDTVPSSSLSRFSERHLSFELDAHAGSAFTAVVARAFFFEGDDELLELDDEDDEEEDEDSEDELELDEDSVSSRFKSFDPRCRPAVGRRLRLFPPAFAAVVAFACVDWLPRCRMSASTASAYCCRNSRGIKSKAFAYTASLSRRKLKRARWTVACFCLEPCTKLSNFEGKHHIQVLVHD